MTGARITGLGVALPRRVVTNEELASGLGLTPEWIASRTGIHARHVAGPHESTETLASAAAFAALTDAGTSNDDIDLVICASVTSRFRFPSTAAFVQDALGIRAPAFDLNAACSGFLFALNQADASIRSGGAERVLVIGAEVLSRITDAGEPKTAVLFGDGAGAAIVERCENAGELGPFCLFTDGSRPELLHAPHDGFIRMQGREVYRAAVDGMAGSVRQLLTQAGVGAEEVDLLIAHQANQRILDAVAKRLGLDDSTAFSNIARYGNTSAASIPLALHEARELGMMAEGDRVVLTAFGAGFSWGAGFLRWGPSKARRTAMVATGAVDA